MYDCQVPHKVTPLFSGTGMIMPWNVWDMFINLFLKTSSKGLIPLVSLIILLSSFKILSAGLAFSRKERCLLPYFCKDLLLSLECTCALSNVVLCHKANGSMRFYLLIKIFFFLVKNLWMTQEKQDTGLCSEHQCSSLLGSLFPKKWEIGGKHGCNLTTAKTTVTKSPETEK